MTIPFDKLRYDKLRYHFNRLFTYQIIVRSDLYVNKILFIFTFTTIQRYGRMRFPFGIVNKCYWTIDAYSHHLQTY